MMPLEVAELEPIYTLTVRGDSMKDAGIASGDELRVLATPVADDGDIVVALVDGEYTVKMLFTDDEGHRWLVPANSRYKAMTSRRSSDSMRTEALLSKKSCDATSCRMTAICMIGVTSL